MARRTWAQLAALLADNNTGEISEADLRDAVIDSAMPHVEARPPSSSDHEGGGFDVGHTWIDTSASPMPEAWRCVFSNTSTAIWSRIEGQKGDPGDPGSPGANGADGTPQWQGPWSAGTYAAGEAVSHGGSSFVANTTTTQEPPHSDWDVLAAKGDSGGGAFTDLSDAPSSYSGAGGKVVAVNSGATALEFIDPPSGGGIQPEDGVVVIKHGANASHARTAGAATAYWQGSVPPDERLLGDWWLYTTVYD